jgi:hypothetical protein
MPDGNGQPVRESTLVQTPSPSPILSMLTSDELATI